jgi:hypothetical protein
VQASAPDKTKPSWAGGDLLSRVVNAAISTPGLYDVMKLLARQTLISTVRGAAGVRKCPMRKPRARGAVASSFPASA